MDPQLLLSIGVLFFSMAFVGGAVAWLLTDAQFAQRRLATVVARPSATIRRESLLEERLPQAVKQVRAFVPKSPKEMNRIERTLSQAGYHGPWPTTLFALAQVVVPLTFFFAILWYFGTSAIVFALIFGAMGYYIPTLWLGRAINHRRREIQNGLPDATDLMIVCIEAGSGIDQALNKVAEELAIAYPALARELDLISAETRAGKPRLEAFRNFADRTKVEDVRSLVAMLIQTDRFGTSIGQALRTHAETSRTKRRQRAEEKAAKLAVKLLFPLVFCLFPAFYVIVLGPSMLNLFRHFVYGFGG